jgi:hypothetical protein
MWKPAKTAEAYKKADTVCLEMGGRAFDFAATFGGPFALAGAAGSFGNQMRATRLALIFRTKRRDSRTLTVESTRWMGISQGTVRLVCWPRLDFLKLSWGRLGRFAPKNANDADAFVVLTNHPLVRPIMGTACNYVVNDDESGGRVTVKS